VSVLAFVHVCSIASRSLRCILCMNVSMVSCHHFCWGTKQCLYEHGYIIQICRWFVSKHLQAGLSLSYEYMSQYFCSISISLILICTYFYKMLITCACHTFHLKLLSLILFIQRLYKMHIIFCFAMPSVS